MSIHTIIQPKHNTKPKLKHSKFKNTGILFELLVRQMTSDVLNKKLNSPAVKIIKNHFTSNSELNKELQLYKTINEANYTDIKKAEELLLLSLNQHSALDTIKLKREKYNLIKSITENYDISNFSKYKIDKYSLNAAIYKVFSLSNEILQNKIPPRIPIQEVLNNKYLILDHIARKSVNNIIDKNEYNNTILNEYILQHKDIRLLSYTILVDKFNEKYSSLNESQKNIIKQYIYLLPGSIELKQFISEEFKKIKKIVPNICNKISDKVTSIKLNEMQHVLDNHINIINENIHKELSISKIDNNILKLLQYYELIKESKKIIKYERR